MSRRRTTSRFATRRSRRFGSRSPRGKRAMRPRCGATCHRAQPRPQRSTFARARRPRRAHRRRTSSSRSHGTASSTSIAARCGILARLDRYPVFRFVNRLTGNAMPPRRSPFSSVAVDTCAPPAPLVPGDEIPFRSPSRLSRGRRLAEPADARHGHRSRAASNRVRAVMSAIDSYAKRLCAARIAHRHQHDPFRALAGHRRRPPADDGERLRRLVGKLHRRVRRDDPVRSRRDLGERRSAIRRTARGICRRSSGFCAATRCRPTCSSAPIPTRHRAQHRERLARYATRGPARVT